MITLLLLALYFDISIANINSFCGVQDVMCIEEKSPETVQHICDDYLHANTVADMKKMKCELGSTIHTRGYYRVGDGGDALYSVCAWNTDIDDTGGVLLDNGLVAELIVDKVVNIDQLGAHGNGQEDDSYYLQTALTAFGTVELTEGKTYKLCKGIVFPSSAEIIGNNATLLIRDFSTYSDDNISENKRIGDFYYQFFMPENYYAQSENLVISDLKIDWKCEKIINHVSTYFLFRFQDINLFEFDNVSIIIDGEISNSVQPLTFNGRANKVILDGCRIINKQNGYYGSCVWFQSFLEGGFPDVIVRNSYFYSSSRDEIIGGIGPYYRNILVDNCTFVQKAAMCKNNNDEGTLEIVVSNISYDDKNHVDNEIKAEDSVIEFDNCIFSVEEKDSLMPRWFTSATSMYGKKVKTIFKECNITGKFSECFISGDGLAEIRTTNIDDTEEYHESVGVEFVGCELNVVAPTFINSRSTNCLFENCRIKCSNALVDMLYVDKIIACGKYVFRNNTVEIDNGDLIVFKDLSEELCSSIIVENNIFIGDLNKEKLYSLSNRHYDNFIFRHNSGAESKLEFRHNKIKNNY